MNLRTLIRLSYVSRIVANAAMVCASAYLALFTFVLWARLP